MSCYTVTVFTRPGCRQCLATMRRLDRAAVPYDVQAVAHHEQLVEVLKANHMLELPLVVIRSDGQTASDMLGRSAAQWLDTATAFWSGFRPDKIDSWITTMAEATGAEAAS